MSQEKIQITLSVLTEQVNAGMKKTALAQHYGLKESQMTKVLQAAGLKIRKFHAPIFELVNDLDITENPQSEVEEAPIQAIVFETMEEEEAHAPETAETWR
jgi:hypothetical protein